MADTTERHTGVRRRLPGGEWSVPSGTPPKKVVKSRVREQYGLLTEVFSRVFFLDAFFGFGVQKMHWIRL
jgi:hypothetical protein